MPRRLPTSPLPSVLTHILPSTMCAVGLTLLQLTGCRASEALSLTWANVSDDGNIALPASKGGLPRYCYVPELIPYFLKYRGADKTKIITCTYRQLYLYCLRQGLTSNPPSHTKYRAVTHASRYVRAQLASKLSAGNRALIAGALGHKSLTSQHNYTEPG